MVKREGEGEGGKESAEECIFVCLLTKVEGIKLVIIDVISGEVRIELVTWNTEIVQKSRPRHF